MQDVQIGMYGGVGDLILFSPDLEGSEPPVVSDFCAKLQTVGGVLIACPEYPHGVPGALKNALDLVVGSRGFVGKPVALISYPDLVLVENLPVMTAALISEASIRLPLPNKRVDTDGILADLALRQALRSAIAVFAGAIKKDWAEVAVCKSYFSSPVSRPTGKIIGRCSTVGHRLAKMSLALGAPCVQYRSYNNLLIPPAWVLNLRMPGAKGVRNHASEKCVKILIWSPQKEQVVSTESAPCAGH